MRKKLISVLLSIAMALTFVASPLGDIVREWGGISASAGGLTLSQLQAKFPNGAYWNHAVNSYNQYGDVLMNNWDDSFADSISYTPCANHNGTPAYGSYDCNVFSGSMQCCGFAKKLAYDAYGSSCTSWGTTSTSNVKPGDVIHYFSSETTNSYGHWVMVIGVSGNNITVGECNAGSAVNSSCNCKITWGRTINMGSFYSNSVIYSAPSTLVSTSTPVVNITTPIVSTDKEFYEVGETINISWTASPSNSNLSHYWLNIDNPGVNLFSQTMNKNTSYSYTAPYEGKFTFVAYATSTTGETLYTKKTVVVGHLDLGESFYAAIVKTDGWKVLTVADDDVDNPNVYISTDVNKNTQRWKFVRQSDGSYKIYSGVNQKCLDVFELNSAAGTNVQVYNEHTTPAQNWYIYGEDSAYVLRAQTGDCVLDVYGGNSDDGTNVQMYTPNNSSAQKFQLYRFDYDVPEWSYVVKENEVSIYWDKSDVAEFYNLIIKREDSDKDYSIMGTTGSGVSLLLPLGNYSVQVESMNCFGEMKLGEEKRISVTECELSKCAILIDGRSFDSPNVSYEYTGSKICPKIQIYDGDYLIDNDFGCNIEYSNNVNAGTATVTIKGINGYYGTITKTFTIKTASISDKKAALSKTSYMYNLKAKTPIVTIDGLTKGIDYTVSYSNNVKPGTGKVIIKGIGNFTGTLTKTFTITKGDIALANVTLSKTSYMYNLKAKTPIVTIDGLTKGTDYTVSYSNNVKPGTGKVIIKGIGNFTGTLTKTFTITKGDIALANAALSKTSYVYYGNAKTPIVTIDGLTKGTDYTVSYLNNVNVGTGTVVIKGIGNFTGTLKKNFTIKKA